MFGKGIKPTATIEIVNIEKDRKLRCVCKKKFRKINHLTSHIRNRHSNFIGQINSIRKWFQDAMPNMR